MIENNYNSNNFEEKHGKIKNKKLLIMVLILGVIFITFGFTYALFEASRNGKNNNVLVAGDIYMHYNESNVLNLNNASPREEYDPNSYFEFTIDGKNEYTKKDIWYDITLTYGDKVEGKKTRISDYLLKFRLVENRGGTEKVLFDNKSYNDIKNKRIWVDKIEKDTKEEIKITYKLYMWLSNELEVGNTNTATYTPDVWNNDLYASVKVNVTGDFEEKTLNEEEERAVDVIKKKVNQNGQVIAIDNNSNKCQDIANCNIREYRYSGAVANNYVKLNNNNQDELWRIIGVFKEDNEEYIKLVRNEELPKEIIPIDYVVDGTTYKISTEEDKNPNAVYWNYVTGTEEDKNDWSKAGLQYYLNTEEDSNETRGYLSYLSPETKLMLRDTTYYLGASTFNLSVNEIYNEERDVKSCQGNVGTSFEASGCRVGAGNQAIWPGKVGLMYGSDLGFSNDIKNWNDKLGIDNALATSWLQKSMTTLLNKNIWLISTAPSGTKLARIWLDKNGGHIDSSNINLGQYILPVIALKSNVKITSGTGTMADPYTVKLAS